MTRKVKVGIAQVEAVHLDLGKSFKILENTLRKAASLKLDLIVFGECWLSGYPAWLDHCPEIAQWDNESTKDAYLHLRNSSIEVPGPYSKLLGDLAKKNDLTLVIGVNEIVKSGKGNGTVYNSLLTYTPDGRLANHHRKLMPTYTEKMIYGQGDGHGLKSVETDKFTIGGLICWEHWMPMTRQSLHDEGEDIHVAVWPAVFERHQLASRHYAFEGRSFVLAAGQLIRARSFPDSLTLPDYFKDNPEQLVCNGGSCIINPRGEYIVEPVFDKEEIITATLDLDDRTKEQMTLDTSGHYQRSDIFEYKVNKKRG